MRKCILGFCDLRCFNRACAVAERVRNVALCLKLPTVPYILSGSSEGSGETA